MERVMSEIANELVLDKHLSVVLILTSKPTVFFNLNTAIAVYHLKENNFLLKLFELRKLIKDIKPESVLSFGSMYNSFVLLALLFVPTKIYVSDRSNPYRNNKFTIKKGGIERHDGLFHYFLKRILYPTATGILVQTKLAEKIESKRNPIEKIHYFPNPIKQITLNTNLDRENIILNVGRFVATKNQKDLIDIFNLLNQPDWKLVFIGDGPLLKELMYYASQKETSGKIHFYGELEDVDSYYSRAKIFAFTSLSEGFPNVLGEAMLADLALISYDCVAGPSDIIENEVNGFLIPVNDCLDYKNKLELLINDSDLREQFISNSQEKKSKFDKKIIVENLKEILLK